MRFLNAFYMRLKMENFFPRVILKIQREKNRHIAVFTPSSKKNFGLRDGSLKRIKHLKIDT
jgi:hypothetical protein